jgi:hypothetical protein
MYGKYVKLTTLDKRGWCAPIALKLVKTDDERLVSVTKFSPVDKGTTSSLYDCTNGQMISRTITTAQDKHFNLKVQSSIFGTY